MAERTPRTDAGHVSKLGWGGVQGKLSDVYSFYPGVFLLLLSCYNLGILEEYPLLSILYKYFLFPRL